MIARGSRCSNPSRVLRAVTLALFVLSAASSASPQTAATAAIVKLAFDTASVHETKPSSTEEQSSNVPLGPGDVYRPTGGLLVIRNYPFMQLVAFAYRMNDGQRNTFAAMLPAWGRDSRYSITARSEKTDVTKDELRLMMRSLLADRFSMKAHYESRQTPVFAAQLVTPGKLGPRLRPHPADGCSRAIPKEPTDGATAAPETIDGGFPATCGGLLMMSSSTPTRFHIGARDVSIASITNAMPGWGDLGRPVVDGTGLTGSWDFALEFIPKRADPPPGTPAPPSEGEEPNFLYAVRTQLGIKLEAQKQPVEVLLLDHIDHLSEN